MTFMWNEILEQPAALKRCLDRNIAMISDIVGGLNSKNIDQVVIAARGTSDHAAVYGKYVIELLTGIPVSLAATSIFTIYQRKMNFAKSLIIGISQSGQAADVLETIRNGNESGAITIGISNNADSPIAKESRYFLNCEAGLEKSVAATKTFITEIFLLARLAAEWSSSNELKNELLLIPENISHMFEVSQAIEDRIERYRFMDECFVLARGINYAVSLEAALKIQETAYVRAKAFATSDFQHGPIAMIDKDIPIIIFAPDGPLLNDVCEMIGKLKNGDFETLIISNRKGVRDLGSVSFSIPDTANDMISPFYNVVVAQMFACKLALVKGLNPDSPRGLNKVTITR